MAPSNKGKEPEHEPPSASSGPFTTDAFDSLIGLDLSQLTSPYVSPYPPVSTGTESNTSSRSASSAPTATSSSAGRPSTRDLRFDLPEYSSNRGVSASMPGKQLSTKEKEMLLESLRTHRINTLIELRRVERVLMPSGHGAAEVIHALTCAWAHYVNSNNLLSELRGLTKTYPFSSEVLDEAKWLVISDAQSAKSWNYCWLVLQKVKNQNLIPAHAHQLAARPAMWGGRAPSPQAIEQLAAACVTEWTRALHQLLRHWEAPPTTGGR